MAELMKAIVDGNNVMVKKTLKEMTAEQVNGIILEEKGWYIGYQGWTPNTNPGSELYPNCTYSLSPLHLACLYRNTSAVTALLGVDGINVNQTVKKLQNVSQTDRIDAYKASWKSLCEGYTPIMIAAADKQTQIFTLLVHDDRVDLKAAVSSRPCTIWYGNEVVGLLQLLKPDKPSFVLFNYNANNSNSLENKNRMLAELVDVMNQRDEIKTTKVDAIRDLSEHFGQLLESGEMSDFKIVCGGEEIPCHKNILMARSNVLRSMINNDMKESQENCMDITDLNPKIVKIFVKFIYTGEVASDDLENNAMDLFEVADRYELNGLIKLCENELVSIIDNENVLAIVMKADMYHAGNLREACIKWIGKNREAIVQPEGWRENLKRFPNLLMDLTDAFTS